MKQWIVIAATAVLALVLIRSCGGGTRGEVDTHRVRRDAPPVPAATQAPAVASVAAPAQDTVDIDAMNAAADLVQRYLQAAGAGRFGEADALWAGGRAPDAGDEGGLRALLPARLLQIRSDAPEPDRSQPSRLRVPVQLRLTGADGAFYRYRGDYVVQADAGTRQWRLVGASVHAVIDGR